MAGIILRGQGFKVVHMVHVAPMGGPRRGPQGPKLCKFQTSFSRSSLSRTVKLCIKWRYLFRWRIKVVGGTSQGGPNGPHVGNMLGRGPYVKSNCSSTSWRNAWLDFNQTWQESSSGAGDSKVFIWYMWPPWGPRGRAPRAKTLQISNFFSRSS